MQNSTAGVFHRHSNLDPTESPQSFGATNVVVELPTVRAVVVALVVKRNLEVFPPHIDHCDEHPVLIVNGDLGSRPRKSSTNNEQTKPRFPRRFGASIGE